MAKRTFAARTFLSFTFRSGTWAGEAGAPSPGATLADLLCGPFTSHQEYVDFISTFNSYISDPLLLDEDEHNYLMRFTYGDYDAGDRVSALDRDLWIQFLTRTHLSDHERYPFGSDTPTDLAGSDPLGLRNGLPSGHHVIIVDPLNSAAIKVTRGTNSCTLQDGMTPASPNVLFDNITDNDYNHQLWYWLDNLDESHWGSVTVSGVATVRRFPIQLNNLVIIYVRNAPSHVLDKEIHVRRNNGNWERPQIRIMGYPGDPQRPTINCGASKILSTDPGPPHANSINGYRHMWFFHFQRACGLWWSGIKLVGHRGDPPNRIFTDKLFFHREEDTFGPDVTPVFWDSEFLDCRGIPSDYVAADPLDYPDWIDSQYNNRWNHVTGNQVNPYNSAGSVDDPATSVLRITVDGTRVERCHVRSRAIEGPPFRDEFDGGDGIGVSNGVLNVVVRRCLADGRTAHAAINLAGVPSTIEYCDISNPDHTCCGASIIQYNRIHDWTTRIGETDAPGHGVQLGPPEVDPLTGAIVKGNVFYNAPQMAGYYPTAAIWISAHRDNADVSGTIISQNIMYKAGMRLGYAENNPGTSNRVKDTNTNNNAIVDLPFGNNNSGVVGYDAPILLNLFNFSAGDPKGNVWTNNLVTRFDAETTMVVQDFPTPTQYTLAQLNGFTGSSGNYNSAPLFLDPDNGDFRLAAGSPLTANLTDDAIPFLATPAWDEYDELALLCGIPGNFCCEITIRPQYTSETHIRLQYSSTGLVMECECP